MERTACYEIAFVGDYLPRKCGIATFTHDLRGAVAKASSAECIVVPMDDISGGYAYESEVQFQVVEQELEDYREAADFLNLRTTWMSCRFSTSLASLAGPAEATLLGVIARLANASDYDAAHCVVRSQSTQQAVMTQLVQLSTRLVVMTERCRQNAHADLRGVQRTDRLDCTWYSRCTLRGSG